MKTHEFFYRYANTPLAERDKGETTLNEIYTRVKEIQDRIRPDVIERDRLLDIAQRILN